MGFLIKAFYREEKAPRVITRENSRFAREKRKKNKKMASTFTYTRYNYKSTKIIISMKNLTSITMAISTINYVNPPNLTVNFRNLYK